MFEDMFEDDELNTWWTKVDDDAFQLSPCVEATVVPTKLRMSMVSNKSLVTFQILC